MTSSYVGVGVYFVLGIAFVAATLITSWLLRPHHPHQEKLTTYECGERPSGGAWVQFRVLFYVIAISFVVFDVEVVFMIPWAIGFQDLSRNGQGLYALGVMLVFVVLLLVGWLWEMRRRAYDWE